MNEPRTNVQELLLDPHTKHPFRLRRLGLGGIALTLFVAACTADPVVYPNRNPAAASGGLTDVGEGGEAGAEVAEMGGNGGNGKGGKGGTGGTVSKGGTGGSLAVNGGTSGGPVTTGPVCGDGKIEAPEDCEDGNTDSGDGCSADCQSACEICEQNVCPLHSFGLTPPSTESPYEDCYRLPGTIETGPAMGVTRAEVCRELVDCIREEDCLQTKGFGLSPLRCWCDKDWVNDPSATGQCIVEPDPQNPTDPTKFIPGKCASLFQDATESPKLIDVLSTFRAPEIPVGAAIRLLAQCDTRVCTEECLPTNFRSTSPAMITGDILAERNSAGESPLGDLFADAQRDVAQADFAFVHPISFADSEIPGLVFDATPSRAADAPGRVLWSEVRAVTLGYSPDKIDGISGVAPYDISILKVSLTGQQIYNALEQQFGAGAEPTTNTLHVSGLTYTWDAAKIPPNLRVIEVRKGGVALDKAATYTVALGDRLLADAGPIPALRKISNPIAVPDVVVDELLGDYLAKLPQPVAPPALNRITRLN